MNSKPDHDTEVVIIGGGLTGATLALLLARAGIQVMVLERETAAPGSRDDPRALAITRASENILRTAGAWACLPDGAIGRIEKMLVWDAHGEGKIEFDSAELCEAILGYIIQQSVLEEALIEACEDNPNIKRQQAQVEDLEFGTDSVRIVLENGTAMTADLVVAADGNRSQVRELAGIAYPRHDYQQQAVACRVETELSHDSIARQCFLAEGPLAFLPLADPHQCGIVWSTSPEQASRLLAMDDAEFNEALGQAFSHTLGGIISSTKRVAFPLYHAQAERYCRLRLALIGDAAHCVHPLAGQGANLGLLDAATLAEVVTAAWDKGSDMGSLGVLRRYERWRKGENYLMLKVFQGFKVLFENRLTSVRLLRNAGLKLTDLATPLKHAIIRRASGLSGDLPQIARKPF